MEIALIILGVIILALMVERYYFAKEMHKQLENANKAVMSRNINDYIAATSERKETIEPPDADEVELSEASDELFDKFITKNIV